MLSRITGLIRELLIAKTFGASVYTDAFFVAFRIPNLLRRLFAEGAFSQAFIPILTEYKNKNGELATKNLVDDVSSLLLWTIILITIAGIILAPLIVILIAGGFTSEPMTMTLSVNLTRIMFPYIFFMSLVTLAGGILNTNKEFKIPAFTPVLLNLSFILIILFLVPNMEMPIYALSFAVFIGGILQLLIQIPALIKINMFPKIHFNLFKSLNNNGVKRVLKQMVPATFAVSASQISLIINTNIASHLDNRSVSWLSYADRLMELPTALLGVALATVLLPSLSNANIVGKEVEFSRLLDWGLKLTFLLALPAGVGLIILSEPITATLFHYGQFDDLSVKMTSIALAAYGIGLIGIIQVKILAPGFYAKQNIKTPVKIGLGVLLITQIMNLFFVPILNHAGLALSVGIGAIVNSGLLYFLLKKRGIYKPHKGWLKFILKILVGIFILTFLGIWLSSFIDWIALKNYPLIKITALSFIIISCKVFYFLSLYFMGLRPKDFLRNF
tara:strand:+ start:675 stop:2180 length:1506 start_codon:yes stop_codon:yes gene_type:complete